MKRGTGRMGAGMGKWLALVMTLFIAAIIGFGAQRTPLPKPATAPAMDFAAGRAMADVRIIAKAPHPTGSAANIEVRTYLTGRLQALGFMVRQSRVTLPEKARMRMASRGAPAEYAINIIALRPGRDPAAPAVAVMAHYDSVPGSPGAADDAAGVAAALEIARAIPRQAQARDLVLLFTDAEEAGLNGARDFFGEIAKDAPQGTPPLRGDPLAGRIGAVINLEARGGGGRAMMFETGPGNGAMVALFRQVVSDPAANSLAVKIYELLPNNTDFTPAKQRGLSGVNFAFVGDAWQYHSPLATPDALDQGALQHIGGQALAITRALLTVAELPAAAPDAVFSDVLGVFIIAYPPAFGWVVVAAIALALLFVARRRAPQWRGYQVAGGAGDGLGAALAAAVLLYAGNLLSGADGPTNYYDRLAALPRLELIALLLVPAGMALMLGVAAGRRNVWGGWLGLALLNFAGVVAVQVMLPAAAPILAWPLLVATLALLPAAAGGRLAGTGLLLPAAAAAFGLAMIGGVAHFALLGVGITMPGAIAIFVPLLLLLLWPLLPAMTRRAALLAALALIVAAAALALWVRLDPLAASVPPYAEAAGSPKNPRPAK